MWKLAVGWSGLHCTDTQTEHLFRKKYFCVIMVLDNFCTVNEKSNREINSSPDGNRNLCCMHLCKSIFSCVISVFPNSCFALFVKSSWPIVPCLFQLLATQNLSCLSYVWKIGLQFLLTICKSLICIHFVSSTASKTQGKCWSGLILQLEFKSTYVGDISTDRAEEIFKTVQNSHFKGFCTNY